MIAVCMAVNSFDEVENVRPFRWESIKLTYLKSLGWQGTRISVNWGASTAG